MTTRSLDKVEQLVLGPSHEAQHVAEAKQARAAQRAWHKLTAAQKKQLLARASIAARRRSRAAAGPLGDVGQWTSGPFRLPVFAIHAAMLPTGKVLFFAFPLNDHEPNPVQNAPTLGDAWLWDPSATPDQSESANPFNEPGVFKRVPPPFDPETGGPASLFCAGLSMLPNGDVFVTGGTLRFPTDTSGLHLGLKRAYTFNPWTETWIQQPDMQHGRWYPSHVELPDGRVAVLAGLLENENTSPDDNAQLEVFTPSEDPSGVGTWQYFPSGDRLSDLYPHMTLLGNGKVFMGGPGPGDSAVLDPATMTWTDVGNHGPRRMYGTELLDPNGTGPSNKITEIGGFPDVDNTGTHDAVATSQTIDLVSAPQWNLDPSGLNVARANHNTLWLPDGTALTIGGGNGRQGGTMYALQNGSPEHQVELYNPSTGQWTLGPAQQIDRAYHSTAVLLPDGRVLSAGDDNAYVWGKPFEGADHNSGEIYSPPYLYRGTRPRITSAPNGTLYGSGFHVNTADVFPGQAHAVLIPPAAVTHATNPNPRIVPLQSSATGSGLDLTAPANANIAPRGWYMLFVVNSSGVPSVASWIHVGYPSTGTTGSGGVAGAQTKPSRTVTWVKVKKRQSFRRGRFVVTLGLTSNRSTIRASAYMQTTVTTKSGSKHRTRLTLLAKKVVRNQQAGTRQVVIQLSRKARRRLLAAKHPRVVLRVQVTSPGVKAYNASKAISNTR